MDPCMMAEYGIILESTPKLGFKNGTQPFFTKLATFFNDLEPSKKHRSKKQPAEHVCYV